jgi:S-DNA-T family DNA segregation ATPase FtsK/SpoIIIE
VEIVVTTPHGDADIRVANRRATTTLAELIAVATGQASPAVVRVDGRTVDASTTLDHTGLRRGSVVDTRASAADTEPAALASIAQIAGPGAGRRRALGSGRHRLGPGRRVNAAELASAPVEEPVVTIDVGTDAVVTLHPVAGHSLALGGTPVDEPTAWNDADVAVIDDRAFVIDRSIIAVPTGDDRGDVAAGRAGTDPGPDGCIAFHRRPRTGGATVRRPAIDAVRDAATRGSGLWQRRPGDADAFVVPIGMRASGQPPDVVSIDLAANRIVSIAGPRRAGAARALLLEATTLHGPADLEVVVATVGLDDWDWAKWLPHVQATGRPAILRDATEIAAWCDAVIEHEPSHPTLPRLTLLVVDDPELWTGRESPLHRLLTTPPDHLRFVALSAAPADAPPTATILFADDAQRRWQLVSTTGADGVEDVLAALVETDVARRVAISMAALDDQEAPVRLPTSHADPHPLRSFVAPTGHSAADGVIDELCTHGAVIVGTDHETARTATVLALRRCLAQPCWLLDLLGSPWTAGLDGLTGRCDDHVDSATVDPDRLSARLRHHLADGSTAVVVLVDADHEAGARVIESAVGLDGITVLATTSSEPAASALPVVRVERRDGRRRARIDVGGVEHTVALDDDPDTGELSVRALVADRPLTALERRIEREATRHPEAFVEQCRALVAEFAPRTGLRPPVLARPPLPSPLPARSLFARYPGDGIPIGLVDDPADNHDTLWWRPDDGHLVAVGPGLDGLLDTVLTGLVDRYGDDEIEIIDGRAITANVDGDVENDVGEDDVITALLERLDQAAQTDRGDGTLLVVVVDDLGALRRRTLTDRLATAFASGRFAVVGRAPTLEDAGVIATDAATTLLVASPGDARGRCRLAADGRLVQLADADRSMTATGSTP